MKYLLEPFILRLISMKTSKPIWAKEGEVLSIPLLYFGIFTPVVYYQDIGEL